MSLPLAGTQVPSIGRIVHFTLSESDAEQINFLRDARIQSRQNPYNDPRVVQKPLGFQDHIGNKVVAGQLFPMMITRVWGSSPDSVVNGQVFLDGNDVHWVTSVQVGDGTHAYQWPVR